MTTTPSTKERKEPVKNILRKGIVSLTAVIITAVMLASGAQAATSEQKVVSDYVSSMRNEVGLPSLRVDEQMTSAAQAWADHLAAVDSGHSSYDPNLYQPSGTMGANSVSARWSRNDAKAGMDTYWAGDAGTTSIIDTPSWNTVGTGFAVAKSGAIYLVADMAYVKPAVVVAAPLPAPVQAPVVAAPAPVVIPQPEPVQAAPVGQATVQADPAPAPAATNVPEAPKPTEAPKETATPTATATPTETASASASATASPDSKSMDSMRTSDNTSPFVISKETQQVIFLGGGGPVFAGGLLLVLRNRKEKKPVTE